MSNFNVQLRDIDLGIRVAIDIDEERPAVTLMPGQDRSRVERGRWRGMSLHRTAHVLRGSLHVDAGDLRW